MMRRTINEESDCLRKKNLRRRYCINSYLTGTKWTKLGFGEGKQQKCTESS
jgi:hypothetical protein